MLTNDKINKLIAVPKHILKVSKNKITLGYYRRDMELKSDDGILFSVFMRQNIKLIENFSIGLMFVKDGIEYNLLRFNGMHGKTIDNKKKAHHKIFHIHKLNETVSSNNPTKPSFLKEGEYTNFETAMIDFFNDCAIIDYTTYFPEIMKISFDME